MVQPGTAMEYAVTTSIKKLTVTNKPKIGFIQGHGEASLQEMGQVYQSLDILYDVQSVYLTDTTNTSEYKTIVLVKPSDSIPPSHLQALDQYVYKGGNLIIAMNQVEANLQQGLATASSTGLDVWLSAKGIFVDTAHWSEMSLVDRYRFNNNQVFSHSPLLCNYHIYPSFKILQTTR
ncbi:MAG: GldG family protein [Saprospiraceae bacterium]|nr:GldG family protein [Saprospiraceae bacterium]